MNFRQRIAWLLVVLYLLLTCALVHYIFEISDRFNQFALDHVERFHKAAPAGDSENAEDKTDHRGLWYFWLHFTDVPLWTWLLIAVLPYLQVFFMLMAFTKADPQLNTAFMWPIYTFMKLKNWFYGMPPEDVKYAVPVELNGKMLDT